MGAVTPVVALILLSFAVLLGLALTAWAALTLRDGAGANAPAPEPRAPREDRRGSQLSNDVVRGARAPRKHPPADVELPLRRAPREPAAPAKPPLRQRASSDEDPFERFLRERSRSDDLDF